METPSSTRRVTRSQTLAVSANSNTNISRKMEDYEKGLSKSSKQRASKQDRSALIDITNDSPIVGLASGNLKTPISLVNKQRSNRCKRTPGSGEALLRGQVKNLLQKVEEEAEISKFSLESNDRPIRNNLKAFLNSPAGLLAPTPANTPQVLNFSSMVDEFESLGSVSESPVEDQLNLNIISQMVSEIYDGKKQAENGSESEKDMLSRSLFLDFIDKSDSSSKCSSVVTDQGTQGVEKPAPPEDDDASIWSIQVNASTRDEDEDEDEVIEDEAQDSGDVYDDDEDFGEEGDWLLDDLCEEMSNGEKEEAKFMGKHTRFVYDSDDELVEKHEDCDEMDSTEVLRLKGLPTPKGKHLRFQDEEGDDQ